MRNSSSCFFYLNLNNTIFFTKQRTVHNTLGHSFRSWQIGTPGLFLKGQKARENSWHRVFSGPGKLGFSVGTYKHINDSKSCVT